MAGIKGWNRIEPSSYHDDVDEGIRARSADPLWILGRQWQMGEFRAEDSGSPASVQLTVDERRFRFARHRNGEIIDLPVGAPLESFLFNEPRLLTYAERVEWGLMVEDLILSLGETTGRPILTALKSSQKYGLDAASSVQGVMTEQGRDDLLILGQKTDRLDGYKLYQELQPRWKSKTDLVAGSLAEALRMVSGAGVTVGPILQQWMDWMQNQLGGIQPADLPAPINSQQDSLVWSVELSTASNRQQFDDQSFRITPDSNGDVHWYSCDVTRFAPAGPGAETATMCYRPSALRFAGMPSARFWDFETDELLPVLGDVDFQDVHRMAVIEFAMVSSDNWFLVPYLQSLGSVAQIRKLVVTDVFGATTEIPPTADSWQMFQPVQPDGKGYPLHVLLGRADGSLLRGPEMERLRLQRDEMANLVWAVQDSVQDQLGYCLNESDLARTSISNSSDSPAPAGAKFSFQIAPSIPAGRTVFTMDGQNAGDSVLTRSRIGISPAYGRILQSPNANHGLQRLGLEQVSQSAVIVSRSFRRTRRFDGTSVVWTARRHQFTDLDGSLGIKFDQLIRS